MSVCTHKRIRPLDCDEHGRLCPEVICCDCGESVNKYTNSNLSELDEK